MYKISQMPQPELYITEKGKFKVRVWRVCGRYAIKSDEGEDGFGDYLCFTAKITNLTEYTFADDSVWHYADVYFDLEEHPWIETDIVCIVDDTIWIEAIKGGKQWFKVEEIKNGEVT